MDERRGGEIVTAGEPGKPGKTINPSTVGRQVMGLFVQNHLQPILDAAQEAIGGAELTARLLINPPTGRQRVERRERALRAQLRMASARDELLGLHEELDLANAAATELDIVPLDRDLVVPAIGVNLPFHRVNIGDRREVEILAPDEGRKL